MRHAAPNIEPEIPPPNWTLSPTGIDSCIALGDDLRSFIPSALMSSTEPKAIQTATVISERLGLDLSTRDGLREHRRSGEFLPESDFHSNIKAFFQNPTKVVFGQESCDALGLRIDEEVDTALSRGQSKNAILVTHGTAMTSFIWRHWQVNAHEVWMSLGLPAYLAFTVPTFDIVGSTGVDTTLLNATATGA